MNNNYESVADLLKKEEEQQNIKTAKAKVEKRRKSKKFIVGVTALITAGVIAITSGVAVLVNHFKKKNNNEDLKTPNTSISTMNIGDMGTELEFPKKEETKTKYENPTGKADLNKIVEKDGKLYVDKEFADKSKEVGKVSIDTKGDTLKVDSDGKVKEKTEGYEIKDDKGNVIDKGNLDNTGKPEGYEEVEEGKYLPEGYVYADATYYNEEGKVLLEKGEVTTKKNLEYVKKNFSTTKPSKTETSTSKDETTSSKPSNTTSSTTSKDETTSSKPSNTTSSTTSKDETTSSSNTNVEEGKVNEDGTYTIYGLTFESKADYEQWVLQEFTGYAEADGIMKSEQEIQNQIQKQLVK